MSPRVSSSTRKKGLEFEQSNKKTVPKNDSNIGSRKNKNPDGIQEIMEAANKIQKYVEDNYEDVGTNFADEARAIHYGDTEERGIYGVATPTEIEDLNEEDIPINRLPWKKHNHS